MLTGRPPSKRLRTWIEALWLSDNYVPAHSRERILPAGTLSLILDLRKDRAFLCGARDRAVILDAADQRSILGVAFEPGRAFPFLGFPAVELRNRQVRLEDVWGPTARLLREQVLEAATPAGKFDLLERFLLERQGTRSSHAAVGSALRKLTAADAGRTGISGIAQQLGLSHRRFIELFAREVGLTPKQFARVRRLQKVVRHLRGKRDVDWLDVCFDAGYYDQAHFVHDFREFSGLTPTAYLAARGPHLNHLPAED